jgi:hypothetical protein
MMEFEKGKDYYLEEGSIVLTDIYLKKRGKCCSSHCRHCPYDPPYEKGNSKLKEQLKK